MRIGGKGQIRWTAVGVEAGGRSKWTERTKEKTKEKRKRKNERVNVHQRRMKRLERKKEVRTGRYR